MRASSFVSMLFAAGALVATAAPAAADIRDIDSLAVPVGACRAAAPDIGLAAQPGTGVNDGAFPHICRADIPQAIPFQASTGEWILFRIGDLEATQAACQQFSDSVTISYSLDGQPVNSDILPCQQRPDGSWFIDYRFLSHPLPPGVHTLTVTFTTAGGSVTLQRSVDIVPKG